MCVAEAFNKTLMCCVWCDATQSPSLRQTTYGVRLPIYCTWYMCALAKYRHSRITIDTNTANSHGPRLALSVFIVDGFSKRSGQWLEIYIRWITTAQDRKLKIPPLSLSHLLYIEIYWQLTFNTSDTTVKMSNWMSNEFIYRFISLLIRITILNLCISDVWKVIFFSIKLLTYFWCCGHCT